MVYIDLEGAFDKIWHDGLLYKLARCGIRGEIINWLHNYLDDRKIKVRLNDCLLEGITLPTGVPQGAVLSPFLFNMMLSDILQKKGVKVYYYADDGSITAYSNSLQQAKKTPRLFENIS